MTKIVGVRFRNTGKSYYFDPKDMELMINDKVIVETARGVEVGTVTIPVIEVADEKVKQPIKEVQRKATPEDIKRLEENQKSERDAYKICQERIRDHKLDMKLVQAEYTFDRNKLLFYFTSDGRVDFRELVKDLASVFHIRIELRQIGVRDETKILGGIGICGRELCCKTYLSDFAPVSIKMAKEQSLSLNPTKISGVCGRLMCCLKNEQETYEYLNKQVPKKGDLVETMGGDMGEVIDVNVLRQTVRVLFEEDDTKEIREYTTEEITVKGHKKKGQQNQQKQKSKEEEEAKQLEVLDRREEKSGEGAGDQLHKKGEAGAKKRNPNKDGKKNNHHHRKRNKDKQPKHE